MNHMVGNKITYYIKLHLNSSVKPYKYYIENNVVTVVLV